MGEGANVRVIVGCECSGVVREAFRTRGHDAWSCDLLPAEDGSPYHIRVNEHGLVGSVISDPGRWDLGIFHPPCQYIANSGARWLFEKPGRWGHLFEAVRFFRACLEAPIPRVAVENSQPHKWGQEMVGRKYDQKVQPWWFGDKQKKGLCLWLRGLPHLLPDNNVGPPPPSGTEEAKAWESVWRMAPGPQQAINRARTFPGFARAMAEQWGSLHTGS